MLSSWYNVHTQLPTVAQFCTAENNPSKSNSHPKHVYFFRNIPMTNLAALRAGRLSLKEYSWFVSSLLRVTAPDSTSGNSKNSGEICQVQGVFLEVWFSRGQAPKYKGLQKVFLKCEFDIFSGSKCIFTEVCRCIYSRSVNISRGTAGVSRGQIRHAIRLIVVKENTRSIPEEDKTRTKTFSRPSRCSVSWKPYQWLVTLWACNYSCDDWAVGSSVASSDFR